MNETFPAEKASLDTLYDAVLRDRPADVKKQVLDWRTLSKSLKAAVAAIDLHASQVSDGSSARSSDAYLANLTRMRGRLEEASSMADSNADNVAYVAEQMDKAKKDITQLYVEREATRGLTAALNGTADPAKTKELDKEYDEKAQYAMWSIARDAKWSADSVQPPSETSAGSTGGGPSVGGTEPGGSSPNGSVPGGSVPGGSTVPAGSAPRPDSGGHFGVDSHGPQLQGPQPGPAAPPSPGPTAPAPPPGIGGNPPLLPPATPPPGGKPPLPPTGTKPSIPPGGSKPTPPPGAKPTVPPARPGTAPPSGTRPPGSGPRPPQSTVKPVIGSRPGTTGMAPTGGSRPGTSGVSRPVIGGRPGATSMPGGRNAGTAPGARPAPAKALIGNNGVVSNTQRAQRAVRVPKAQFGGSGTNRSVIAGVRQAFKPGTGVPAPAKGSTKRAETEPQHRPEGGDYQWTVDRGVVPGVISGGDWTGREHDPGAVARLRAESQRVDESVTVDRLSQQQPKTSGSTADEGFWEVPAAGRGVVVRSRDRRYDANDW